MILYHSKNISYPSAGNISHRFASMVYTKIGSLKLGVGLFNTSRKIISQMSMLVKQDLKQFEKYTEQSLMQGKVIGHTWVTELTLA